jgi:hypothetical protein
MAENRLFSSAYPNAEDESFANPSGAFIRYSMGRPYANPHEAPAAPESRDQNRKRVMRLFVALSAALLGITAIAPAADARPRDREQDEAWRATRQGQILPLRAIEAMIVPRMRGADYLGPEFDGDRYRLKFMRVGQVMWVDVDARTGQIIGKSGF